MRILLKKIIQLVNLKENFKYQRTTLSWQKRPSLVKNPINQIKAMGFQNELRFTEKAVLERERERERERDRERERMNKTKILDSTC